MHVKANSQRMIHKTQSSVNKDERLTMENTPKKRDIAKQDNCKQGKKQDITLIDILTR